MSCRQQGQNQWDLRHRAQRGGFPQHGSAQRVIELKDAEMGFKYLI